MAKSLDANVITELNAQQKKPVLLFEVQLTGLTLRYAAYKTNLTFDGNVYSAKTMQTGNIQSNTEGQINRINIKLDNVSRDMATYANSYEFEGRLLTLKRIYLDANNNPPSTGTEYIELFSGIMEHPKEIGYHWFTISATIGKSLKVRTLKKTYTKLCNHRFGDSDACNMDGNADLTVLKANGTADSGTTSTLVDSALTEVSDHWNNGIISITKSGTTYNRKVADFESATDRITLDLCLPVVIDNTCTYTVCKGCDKTWEACKGTYAYGPSSDNSLNFGGFIHIGEELSRQTANNEGYDDFHGRN